jgi:feruloyl-CoA synthase
MSTAKYRELAVGGCLTANLEVRADGSSILRADEPLEPYPATMNERFAHWAKLKPDAVLVAHVEPSEGDWTSFTGSPAFD